MIYSIGYEETKMLTTNEIADRYSVAYSTVILWIKTGKLEGAIN